MKRKRYLLPVLVFCLILIFLWFHFPSAAVLHSSREQAVIVIDVGHGGFDPGMVSPDHQLEKDLNLAIALRLKSYLEAQDCLVYLTRDSDCSLNDANAGNKKQSDMRNRIAFIDAHQPDLMISIHQNSFSSPAEHGAQSFYYDSSASSKQLAEQIQTALIALVDPSNTRSAKANDSYYILKNASCPAVLVECGFMSNPTESALLNAPIYQEKLAYAISIGIRQYLNTEAGIMG